MKLKKQMPSVTPVLTPSIMALSSAIKILDVKMVQRILEANHIKDLPKNKHRISQYLVHIVRKITFNTQCTDIHVHLFGDNFERGFAIVQLLLAAANEPIDFCMENGFHYMKSLFAMMQTHDRTEASLQREIAVLVSMHKSLDAEFSKKQPEDSVYFLEFQIQFQIKLLVAHFQYDEKQAAALISTIASKVTYKQRFNQVVELMRVKDSNCKTYANAVATKNFKVMERHADDDYINMLIADKVTGELHSPLYCAFKNADKKTQAFLLEVDSYRHLLYPDWLLLKEVKGAVVNDLMLSAYAKPKSTRYQDDCSNWRNSCSVRLFSAFAAHSPHVLSVVDLAKSENFFIIDLAEKNLIGIVVDIIQSKSIANKPLLIAEILKKSGYRAGSLLTSLCPIERLRDQQEYESYQSDRPFKYEIDRVKEYVNIEEFKLFNFYYILFQDVEDEKLTPIVQKNREHYCQRLSGLPDDLLLALLVKYKTQYGLGIWEEVHKRVARHKNELLLAQVKNVFKEEEIRTYFDQVKRLNKHSIPYFFTLSRINTDTKLHHLPTPIVDRITHFIDPKIRRMPKLMSVNELPTSYKTLPVHAAIAAADLHAVASELNRDISDRDAYDAEGLTPLMLCLVHIVENHRKMSATYDSEKRDVHAERAKKLDDILQLLLQRDAKLDLTCRVKSPDGDAVVMTPLHYTLMQGMIEDCKLLLKYGAKANLLDSNGWLPIVYCHSTGRHSSSRFYYDDHYDAIQLLLKQQPTFNQKTCEAISESACGLINYNPDPVIDGVAEFAEAYVKLINSKHQEYIDARDYEKFIEAAREAFATATLKLDLKVMQKIYDEVSQRNQEMAEKKNERVHIESIETALGHFVEVCEEGSAESHSHSYLTYAIMQQRYDIVYWLIETGRTLMRNEDCLFTGINIAEAEKSKFAMLFVAEYFSNQRHLNRVADLIVVYSIFYQIVPMIYARPEEESSDEEPEYSYSIFKREKPPRGDAFLKILLNNLIEVYRFDDNEVLKRIGFVLSLQPKLLDYIQDHCQQKLQQKEIAEQAIARLNLVLNYLKTLMPTVPANN